MATYLLQVQIGKVKLFHRCIYYVSPPFKAELVVGLTVGLSVLLVIIIATISQIFLTRRRRKGREDSTRAGGQGAEGQDQS